MKKLIFVLFTVITLGICITPYNTNVVTEQKTEHKTYKFSPYLYGENVYETLAR